MIKFTLDPGLLHPHTSTHTGTQLQTTRQGSLEKFLVIKNLIVSLVTTLGFLIGLPLCGSNKGSF